MALIYRITLLFVLWSSYCQAQVRLTNFYPASANYHDTLHIVGNGFGNNPGAISVSIGAGKAEIATIQDQLIKVIVPSTATFGRVIVTDLTNKEEVSLSTPFLPTYHTSSFDYTHLSNSQRIIDEEEGLYDLCTCDFDQDGDNDVATVNNDESAKLSSVNVFSNTSSSPDNVSFVKVPGSYFNINQPARNVKCSDINGDGKPDLLVSQGGTVAENIYVFQNISTAGVIKFASPATLSTAFEGLTKGTRRIEVYDLDGDRKPEIIVTNQTSPVVIIFKNETTGGALKFPSDKRHFITVPSNTLGLAISDIDGDKKADIVTSTNLGSNFYIIKNNSENGAFSFEAPQTINLKGQLVNLASGDIDGDKKQDIILTDFEDGAILLLINQSTVGNFSFASPIRMNAALQPWGIALADISGNQQLDMIISTQAASDKILILKNNSLPGDPNFELIQAGYASVYRNINVADINGDSKPDIVSTEKDAFGKYHIAYVENQSCIEIELFPKDPPAICEASPLKLYTYDNTHLDYQWYKNGAPLTGETASSLTVTQAGTYSLQAIDPFTTCLSISQDMAIIEDSGTLPEKPLITAPTQVCEGNDLQLSAVANPSLSYLWRGPNGFESTMINPLIPNISAEHAGEYQLEVREGLCKSSTSSVFISVASQEKIAVNVSGPLVLCPQDSVTFSINDPGLSNFRWFINNQLIAGEVASALVAKASGSYHVTANNVSGCTMSSDPFDVEKIEVSAGFTFNKTTACVGATLSFESNTPSNAGITYEWDYGDGSTSSGKMTEHTYTTEGTYTIKHTVILGDGNCADTQTKTVTVQPIPTFELNASANAICESDSVTLSVSGAYTSLKWEDGSSANPRIVTQGGTYTATASNAFNCSSTQQVTIGQSATPEVMIDPDGNDHIARGDSVELSAQGAVSYLWQPSVGLSDSTIANPMASPTKTTTYTVSGFSEAGCSTNAQITVYVAIEQFTLDALDIYSPNADGIEDSWVINNFDQYPDCYFIIFDLQGREVFRSEAPYQNDWSGTNHQGKDLPSGTYYYVVRCGDKENKSSGSITILR